MEKKTKAPTDRKGIGGGCNGGREREKERERVGWVEVGRQAGRHTHTQADR